MLQITRSKITVFFVSALVIAAIGGCASAPSRERNDFYFDRSSLHPVLNRMTWGDSPATYQEAKAAGLNQYVNQQLHPGSDRLPASVQAQIDALTISQRPMDQLVLELEQQRKQGDSTIGDDEKKAAHKAYQDALNRLAREAMTRSLLRDIYSHNQLREQMTWFWMNHFNVHQGKHNLRAMVGDYEDHAIRPHALGKFRDLLAATVFHPAMLRYLDNEQNAANHLNENYAREIMELHTLGVNGGYTQQDVQELARILTGVGINLGAGSPNVRRELQSQYVRRGLFEFNPNRHDYGDKILLGHVVHGRGIAEVNEAIDRLSRHPATARFISHKLAVYFIGDNPFAAVVNQMSATFLRTDGDIAATLATLFRSTEFQQSLGHVYKDPMHYVVSAVRLSYDEKPILNAGPMIGWLQRMGQPLYGRQTPDGYPMSGAAWASSGQMTTRFEIGKAIGSGSAGLFKTEGLQAQEQPGFPRLANALYYESLQSSLGTATQSALDQAASPQEWNVFLLASPEMMYR